MLAVTRVEVQEALQVGAPPIVGMRLIDERPDIAEGVFNCLCIRLLFERIDA